MAAAYIILFLVTAMWGLTFPMVQHALNFASPFAFVAVRFAIAAVFFGLFTWKRSFRMARADVTKGIALGAMLWAGYILQTAGLAHTTAARSGFITGTFVPLIPVFAWLFFHTYIGLRLWIAVALAFLGTWILSRPEAGGLNFGDMLTLGCAVSFALQAVFVSRWANPQNEFPLTWLQLATAAVLAALAVPFEYRPHFDPALSSWGAAIFTAVIGSAFAYWAQMRYQPRISPASAAVIYACEPVFAGLAAWLLLHDALTNSTLIAAALIVAGMIISSVPVKLKMVRT